jgi:hypothetical protein
MHDLYECKDNDLITDELYAKANRRIQHHCTEINENSCFWMRGILPSCMLSCIEGPSIVNARVWESEGFTEVINRAQIGYSDGTGGQGDISTTIRPAAFGLATFDFIEINGVPTATNIEIIGGETPGRQTVPRSELWGAINLITRVHINVCARLGIDAAYVTQGACNRLRLEKGANGDLWGVFFAILDARVGDIDFHKVSSHIEGIGLKAVMWGYAELVDIIGNALADEAAELAVKLLRPSSAAINEAKRIDGLSFNVCVRIGLIQARIWETLGDAPIHQSPVHDTAPPIVANEALAERIETMRQSGHTLERSFRGNLSGLRCDRCQRFHQNKDFRKWNKPCRPQPIPRQILQHHEKAKASIIKERMHWLKERRRNWTRRPSNA